MGQAVTPLASGLAVTTERRRGAGAGRILRSPAHLALIAAAAMLAAAFLVDLQLIAAAGDVGTDTDFFRGVGARWLADGSYYLPFQIAGPYDIELNVVVLYPPTALLLFVPAAIAPAPFWMLVPSAILAYAMWRWRPSAWALTAATVLLLWPRAHAAFMFGNTDIWAMAAVAAGLTWGWPAVALTIKPVFAPLALLGVKRRSWWVALAILSVVSLAMLPLWLDYLTAMRNLHIGSDYALASVPLLLVPVVAWYARSR